MITITKEYLRQNPNHIFVFGDNLTRKGKAGAAALRDEPNTFGFITKKYPSNYDSSFYRPEEYREVFNSELETLISFIEDSLCWDGHPKLYLISKLGSGLANKYNIFEEVIEPGLEILKKYKNVKFLY